MSLPSSRIRPLVGCSNPAIIRNVVVFPHPDGPSIEKNSPLGISTLMPATAVTSLNCLTRSTSETSPGILVDPTRVERGYVADRGWPLRSADTRPGDPAPPREGRP